MKSLLVSLAFSVLVTGSVASQESSPAEVLAGWLERQAQVQTWSADVVQTRTLKTLTRPLQARGRVWFAHPNRFRWQLGDPPRTVALGSENALVILYPRLERGERYVQGDDLDRSWQEVLNLLEVGFPTDADLFHARYELLSSERSGEAWRFTFRPTAREARRLIETIGLEISPESLTLLATVLSFPEGSTMRTDFENHELNPEIDQLLFDQQIPEGYEVENALAGGR